MRHATDKVEAVMSSKLIAYNTRLLLNDQLTSLRAEAKTMAKGKKSLVEALTRELAAIKSMERELPFIVYKIETEGDSRLALKLGLDHFGHKPCVLLHGGASGKEFVCQASVPSKFQKQLTANEWLQPIVDLLQDSQLTTKRRVHKLSSLKSASLNQIDDVIKVAYKIGESNFT